MALDTTTLPAATRTRLSEIRGWMATSEQQLYPLAIGDLDDTLAKLDNDDDVKHVINKLWRVWRRINRLKVESER